MFNANKVFLNYRRPLLIEEKVKRDRDIIYGGRAVDVQLPFHLHRLTYDYDIYSRHPKRRAFELSHELNRLANSKDTYVEHGHHKETWRVRNKEYRDFGGRDYTIADYTKLKGHKKTVNIRGINYVTLEDRKSDALKNLRMRRARYRAEKDRFDLYRISRGSD